MRLSSVCSYLQEIAGKHATHLDAGYRYMQDTGRVWVLSRLFMNISKFPSWNQDFEAETWPLGLERIFFRREYNIKQGNDTIISASSYWLLIDLKTRRPRAFNINEEVLKANSGKFAMERPSDAFSNVTSGITDQHKVVYSDLDQNRHANNARYVAWILDCFDAGFHDKYIPAYFAIEYKHEVIAGDSVEIYMERSVEENLTYYTEGRITGTGQVCFRSVIRFSALST
jgi:acyl-ACP thioesterase